jgi:hypothetical protein
LLKLNEWLLYFFLRLNELELQKMLKVVKQFRAVEKYAGGSQKKVKKNILLFFSLHI